MFYLYHRETLSRIIKQLETDMMQSNQFFQLEQNEVPIKSAVVVNQAKKKYEHFEEVQKQRNLNKKKEYQSVFTEWDDDLMQKFSVENA